MSTSQRAVMPCGWRVKARMVRMWMEGKTVWSPCYTRAISEHFRDRHYKALYKFTFFILSNRLNCYWAFFARYAVYHGTLQAPRYLGPLDRVADLHGRRALRSASSSRLVVPMFRLSTVGSRTFNVSGPRIWNWLPKDVVSAPTLCSFRRWLKPFLFQRSYPDIII